MRTEALIGSESIRRLRASRVLLFGVGGVGSFAAEALARAGLGALWLVDGDAVSESNINRQLVALHSTVGRMKVDVMRERALDIDPLCDVRAIPAFYSAENADSIDFSLFDYVVDAVDTVASKLLIIERAHSLGVPVISSMGAGNKLDPTAFEIADIYSTSVCPLARVIRHELRSRGIGSLKVVYSKENPIKPEDIPGDGDVRKRTPGSISFVPSSAGLALAGEVIKDIAFKDRKPIP